MSRPVKLPGQDDAKLLGYILHSSAADRSQATYSKDGMYLTVRDDSTAFLGIQQGLVRIIVDRFSFPNPNFFIFERQIRKFVPLTDENESDTLLSKARNDAPDQNIYMKALRVAAEESFQCEVLDAHMKDLIIGGGKEYETVNQWIEKRIETWIMAGKEE